MGKKNLILTVGLLFSPVLTETYSFLSLWIIPILNIKSVVCWVTAQLHFQGKLKQECFYVFVSSMLFVYFFFAIKPNLINDLKGLKILVFWLTFMWKNKFFSVFLKLHVNIQDGSLARPYTVIQNDWNSFHKRNKHEREMWTLPTLAGFCNPFVMMPRRKSPHTLLGLLPIFISTFLCVDIVSQKQE